MRHLKRRNFLGGAVLLGAGATGLTSLAACGDDEEPGSQNLRFAWWGNPTRDELTEAAVAMWEEQSGRQVGTEPATWDDHWTSLATQIAGDTPPDLMQHDYQRLAEYVTNGSLLALDSYDGDPLDLGVIPQDTIDSGRLEGGLYAIPWGINTFAMVSNQAVLTAAGEEQPDESITWSQFHELAIRIGENTPDDVYGSENAMRAKEPMECWLHQRGKALYTADGQLGYDAADLAEWFEFWLTMMNAGGCPGAETVAEGSGALEDRGVPTGTGAFDFHWSNIVPAFVDLVTERGETVGITMYPQGDTAGSPNGQYYKASMYLAVPAGAGDPDGAVELLNALVFDPEIAGSLGIERGVPAAESVREAVIAGLSEAEQVSLEFVERVGGLVGPVPPPPPEAGPEIDTEFQAVAEEVMFERVSPQDGAEQVVEFAQGLLG